MILLPLLFAVSVFAQEPGGAGTPPGESAPPPAEADHYVVTTTPLPEDLVLEVGGILPRDDGSVLACTRRGEVWRVQEPWSGAPRFSLWADGLQEPMGLLEHEGWIWTVQRGELTRMRDRDGDGRADQFLSFCDDWEITGNYHEYAFGPRVDGDGNLWITLNIAFGDQPFAPVDWRGWAMRIGPGGVAEPVCGGLRSPAGVEAAPWGDVFYTDNQGEWCGASKLSRLTPGSWHGHPFGIASAYRQESWVAHPGPMPDGILMPDAAERIPGFTLPAVWFPYDEMGRSPSGMAWDRTGGAFGPFAGQLFVGDQYQASVIRVFLEEVDGRWQGACFPFRKGLASGVTRVRFDGDGGLVVGMSDRGWPSLGSERWGLQRIAFTGDTPFEIAEMRARPDGFRLVFTAPVDPATAADPASYRMRSYTYELHREYGSDEMDVAEPAIVAAEVAADRTTVDLIVEGLRAGYVHELRAEGVRDAGGRPPLHELACYTLVRIPAAAAGAEARAAPPPHAVLVSGGGEPGSEDALRGIAETLERDHGLACTVLDPTAGDATGLRVLEDADLLLLAAQQLRLDERAFAWILRFARSGKPMVRLRGARRAFDFPGDHPLAPWNDRFDAEFFARRATEPLQGTPPAQIVARSGTTGGGEAHPVARGLGAFRVPSALHRLRWDEGARPADLTVIADGWAGGEEQTEGEAFPPQRPVAWARAARAAGAHTPPRGRIFATTLGRPGDFGVPEMRRLALQGILWTLGRENEIPATGVPVGER